MTGVAELPGIESGVELAVVVVGFLALVLTSGRLVGAAQAYVRDEDDDPQDRVRRRAALVIGKAENVLVFTFVLAGAYTALAVVFGAKGIVTRDEDADDAYSLYILTGTLVNFTYSLLWAELVSVGLAVL